MGGVPVARLDVEGSASVAMWRFQSVRRLNEYGKWSKWLLGAGVGEAGICGLVLVVCGGRSSTGVMGRWGAGGSPPSTSSGQDSTGLGQALWRAQGRFSFGRLRTGFGGLRTGFSGTQGWS